MDVTTPRNQPNRTYSSQQLCYQDLIYCGWYKTSQTGITTYGEINWRDTTTPCGETKFDFTITASEEKKFDFALQGEWLFVQCIRAENQNRNRHNLRSSVLMAGFLQSLEFLKKSWNLPNNFPYLEKVQKNGKKYFFFQSYKCLRTLFFFILVKSYSILLVGLQPIIKKLKVSINHLFDNPESGKRNYNCFGKKSEKVLNFGSKNLYEPCNVHRQLW